MPKYFSKLLTILFLFNVLINSSIADVSIHVNSGMDKPIPIAIVDFSGSKDSKNNVNTVITNDLKYSGKFDLLPQRKMPSSPDSAKKIDWNLWDNTGVEYLLVGQIIKKANNTFTVRFELASPLGKKTILGKEYNNIQASQFRKLAHRISDELYQTLTGTRGYFSTKLAYIDVTNPYSISRSIYKLVISDYDGASPHTLLSQKSNPLASPVWSTDGKQIAYVSYNGGRMAIYAVDISSGKRRLISNTPGINSSPEFVPNKNEIIAALSPKDSTQTNLYTIDLTTRKRIAKLTGVGANTEPAFSPNGQKIAFTSNKSGSPQIYIMDNNGRHVHRLTKSGKQNYDPSFMPNGRSIIYMSVSDYDGHSRIAILDLTSLNSTYLTNGPIDKSPSVSPNGQMIVYTSQSKNGQNKLKMVTSNGQYTITLPVNNPDGIIKTPAWSPFL
ncbi:Tol-Pal system beta propeller repeat protein TolB [Francisellaceae bacterium]|nr:Tol-Pal system beta propeller repeat protein TolB [Francisellaceae bacterium]